jgi:hypothetical protein
VQPTEPGTGARDEFYDLVAVLYHALHGAETIGMYVGDAEALGNEQLATFFRQAQDSQRQLAEQAREQLRALEGGASGGGATGFEGETLSAPGTTPSSTPGAPSATTRDVPPRAGDSPPDAPRADPRRPKRRPR